MADISIHFKTSLSNAFFHSDDDNDRFNEWFTEQLSQAGVFDWTFTDTPAGFPGITELSAYINEFTDEHDFYVVVDVDNDTHSFDELYDNEALLDYIDRDFAARLLEEFNKAFDISVPTNGGKSFADLKFDDGEFYSLLFYTEQYGYFAAPHIENTKFQIVYEYDVYV